MSVQLVIELSEEVLKALVASRNLTITVTQSGPGAGAGSNSDGSAPLTNVIPREGSLPARIIVWAETRDREFSTTDVVKKFGVTRAHASMLVAKLAKGPYPIVRQRRGIYQHAS